MINLPIDSVLHQILESLRLHPNLVIEAEPGAGKTTRVPPAVLTGDFVAGGEVWVLEPRRIAARLAARRVAEEMGCRVGETVGYQVRFEERAGPATRLRFLTEGILTRRLVGNPRLKGVAAIVLDEFHERHLQSDVALAAVRALQLDSRPDLRIIVMSATLDTKAISGFLENCPVIRSGGRKFDVAIEYDAGRTQNESLAERVASAVRRQLKEPGDQLVFLPGAADIRRAQAACAEIARLGGCVLLPLHGDMSGSDQDEVVRPRMERRIILSTNVAETSVTIDGIVTVIDSGLARKASHSRWSGLQTMTVERISKASAMQRAGRAGRTKDGKCIRLYPELDYSMRPDYEMPEIGRLDISGVILELAALGVRDFEGFGWFEAPKAESIEEAVRLLCRLGALEAGGSVTPLGRMMARIPAHPRISRLLIEAASRGEAAQGALVAALLGERSLRSSGFGTAPRQRGSEGLAIEDEMELFENAQRVKFENQALAEMGISPGGARAVDAAQRQYLRLANSAHNAGAGNAGSEAAIRISILTGYPDRVAKLQASDNAPSNQGGLVYKMADGRLVQLAGRTTGCPLIVVVQVEEERGVGRSGRIVARKVSRIESEWLFDLFPERISEAVEPRWNAAAERVELYSLLMYDGLVLEEGRMGTRSHEQDEAVGAMLFAEAVRYRVEELYDSRVLESLIPRIGYLRNLFPKDAWPETGGSFLVDHLRSSSIGRSSISELKSALTFDCCQNAWLTPDQGRRLAKLAPEFIGLPGRRRVPVDYAGSGGPSVSSKIQDFFGLRAVPPIGGGATRLVLHLLAPSKRPVQVTSDLEGFWKRMYPEVRRELMRRYPRHKWPLDPVSGKE